MDTAAMTHLRNDADYAAALAEFDAVCLADPGTPESRRFAEIVDLIDVYTLTRGDHRPWPWLAWRRTRDDEDATAASP
jgi:hypothetical protein